MPKFKNPTGYAGRKANQDHTGNARFATGAEVVAASKKDLMVSPATLSTNSASVFASPPALGSTTPAAVTGTTVTATGNMVMSGVATQLQMNGGAVTDFIGQATLVSGTVTIANTNIAATDRIFLSRADENSSSALGMLTVTAQTASTSWVITSLDPADGSTTITGDVSIVNYFIVRQS